MQMTQANTACKQFEPNNTEIFKLKQELSELEADRSTVQDDLLYLLGKNLTRLLKIPLPVSSELGKGIAYCVPVINQDSTPGFETYIWDDHENDYNYLQAGLIHLTARNAIAHANMWLAMSKFSEIS